MSTEYVLRRLSFIKYLYNIAIEQSMQPEPLCAVSILSFHDSIELFLQLGAEYYDLKTKERQPFLGYWEVYKNELPERELSQKESMKRLNESRRSLKHVGTLPSKSDIEVFRANTTSFFRENTQSIFDTNFDDISLIGLVKYGPVRESLDVAIKCIENDNITDALVNSSFAFYKLFEAYENENKLIFDNSVLHKFDFTFDTFMEFYNEENQEIMEFLNKVKDSLVELQETIKILYLNLDYKRYVKFRYLTPGVGKMASGSYGVFGHIQKKNPTVNDFNFCFEYVIQCAIKMQDFVFDL